MSEFERRMQIVSRLVELREIVAGMSPHSPTVVHFLALAAAAQEDFAEAAGLIVPPERDVNPS